MAISIADLKKLMLAIDLDEEMVARLDPNTLLSEQGFDSIDYPAFAVAVEELCHLPREKYLALIASLAAEVAEGGEEMILSPQDASEIGPEVVLLANTTLREAGKPGKLTLSAEPRSIPGGFILSHGDVELNCAFDTLVRLQREKLEKEVAAILFPVQ